MSAKPEVEFSPLLLWENSYNAKYFENGDSYHDGVNGSRMQNHPGLLISTMTFDLGRS